MYKMTIITTGDEEIFKTFGELVFAVLDVYDGIDDDNLMSSILYNLARLGQKEIPCFETETDGLYIEIY